MGFGRLLCRGVALGVLACAVSGCAVFDDRNRRVLNWLDEHAIPESQVARVALAPVALPVGMAAFAADAAVVHPVCSIDDSFFDTGDAIWDTKGESRLRRAVVFPLRLVVTPVFFTGAVVLRSLFSIDANEELDP